jgi:hypothetical protein
MTFLAHCDVDGKLHLDFPAQLRTYCRKRLAGLQVELEVREMRTKRSDRQNKALWAMLSPWAKERGWRVDALKDVVMGIAFGHIEETAPLTGEVVKVLAKPRSSHLNVTEFCHLIETILETAAEDDYYLDAPDEYRKAKEAERRKAAKAA